MTTSLAAQLRKLATPDAQSLFGSKDYAQASFLYDNKEAAKYEKQHFYNIGINGLLQLIKRDDRFREFEQNLFSPSSQTLQRIVQSSETNKLLDVGISKFLLLLSPYMQLREAHKAMEWLVHRYNVHLRNVDDLMMCVLPYHDQEPFIMVLRLLKLNSNDCAKWAWLQPVKEGNTFLPRQTLIMHCRAAKGFVGFICDMLWKHIEANTDESGTPSARHLQRVISFYTQTILGVLLNGPVSESILSTLIPAITFGLKSHDLPDHMVSSYIILSQMFMLTSLNSSLLKSFLNVLAKNAQPALLSNVVMVIIIMFQKQDISKVTRKAFQHLSKHSYLTQLLAAFSKEANTEPFMTPFMEVLTKYALKGSRASLVTSDSNPDDEEDDSTPTPLITLLLDMLSLVPLEQKTVVVVARAILNWYKNRENDAMEVDNEITNTDEAFKVFRLLENKHSSILDTVVKELVSADESGQMENTVKNLFEHSVATAQLNLITDPMSCMAVCLNHHHGAVRKAAVEKLLKDVTLVEDRQSVQSALVLRLQDEDPTVVSAILGNPQGLWEMFSDKTLLYQTLMKKLAALGGKRGKHKTRDQILEVLCYVPQDVAPESEVIVIFVSFLLILDEAGFAHVESLLKLLVSSWSNLLAGIAQELLALRPTPNLEDQKVISDLSSLCDPARNIRSRWHSSLDHWDAQAPPPLQDLMKMVAQLLKDGSTDEKGLAVYCLKLVDSVTKFMMHNAESAHDVIASLYNSLNVTPRSGSMALIILLVTQSLIRESRTVEKKIILQKQLVYMLSDLSFNKHMLQPRKDRAEADSPSKSSRSQEAKTAGYLTWLARSGQLPSDIIVDELRQLELVQMPDTLRDKIFWDLTKLSSLENNWLVVMTTGFNFLLDLSAHKKKGISSIGKELFGSFFKVLGETKFVVRFLCFLWMASDKEGVTTLQKAHILQFSQVYFDSLSDKEVQEITSNPTPVWPCLLILLSNKYERVREIAFNMLASLARNSISDTSDFKWFADKLLRFRQEVTKDHEFLAQVLKTILEDEGILSSPPKKRRKGSSKSPPHAVALTYLLDIICSPETSTSIRSRLLAVLHRLDTADSFLPLMTLLKKLLTKTAVPVSPSKAVLTFPEKAQELSSEEKDVAVWLLKRFTISVAGHVEGNSDALQALLDAMSYPSVVKGTTETIQILAVQRLKRKFVGHLPYEARQAVLTKLLDLLCSSSDPDLARSCRRAVKHMALESSIIADELKSVLAKSTPGTVREAKRQKHLSLELDSLPWKRVAILLEMVQNKRKISSAVMIVSVAFQVLGRVLELEHKGSGEYIKQLLLGTVNFICSRHHKDDSDGNTNDVVKAEHLNMDLIVQCIRSSDNPHTHHQALLLLSTAAKIAPDLLLHNMMTVFTFMGANILRQDDAYSFHVIGRILDNVIPALLMACEEKIKDTHNTRKKALKSNISTSEHLQSDDMMTAVLRVFADAIPHIPAHRKIILFEKLVNTAGVDQYLWRLILLFLESVTVRYSKKSSEEKDLAPEDEKSLGPVTSSDLEFVTSLSEKFSAPQLLNCFHQALTYVIQLPEEKQDGHAAHLNKVSLSLEVTNPDTEIFSVSYHTAKQLRHFKFALIFVLNHLVSSQHLVATLAEADPSSFLKSYQCLMETVLQFICQVTQSHDKHREEASNRFWRILLHKSHDLLDHLVSLLPDSMIMDVVLGLMNHSLPLVQKRAMELLNTKLQHYKDGLSSEQVEMLLSVTKKLQSIVQGCLLKDTEEGARDQNIVNGQTALYSLKVLCRILGEKDQKLFIKIMKICMKVLSHYHDNGMVSASTMLCIAEIVTCVKVHSIEYLKEFMPLVISQLQSEDITRHEVLLLTAMTTLQKIIESVPLFLSPYLLDIIVQVCIISSVIGARPDSHKPMVSQKVKLICTTLAIVTPTRTFLPVLEKSFIALQDKMASCAECAMSMLKDHIIKMSKEDLTTFSHDLLKFFFSCFDIRATHPEISEADLDVIESRVIEAFVSLVFKLSEAQFKPMLLQIYSWATSEDVSRDRVLVFYRLCDSLAERLKNLFTLFAGHIIKHSAEMLDVNNKSKQKCKYFGKGKSARHKSCLLLCYVVDCLQKTFSHDTDGFLTKERFDIIMQSLVDQLENQIGKDSVAEDRITSHLVPCLASLAAAAHDDSLWKDLNYQILLKTRHESPKVRIWALSAIDAFHKQLGEDYTQFVPETIPFMAELMEDESDEVEKYTQKVLAAMEVSVGENLQEYF